MREGRFDAAVEEIGDVGVLLCLGHVELAPAQAGEDLGQAGHRQRRKCDRNGQTGLVIGHRHDVQISGPLAAVECLAVELVAVDQGVGQLARAIGAEVEVDHHVAVADRSVDAVDHGRLDELVVLAAGVAVGDGCRGTRRAEGHGRARSRRTRAGHAPSADRGPCRSSARRWWRCVHPDALRPIGSRNQERRRPPSAAACRGRRAVRGPRRQRPRPAGPCARSRRRAGRPSGRHRVRAGRRGGVDVPLLPVRPPCCRAGLTANDPSAIAASMRGRSCTTGRPAPRLRWPTSLLPI